MDCTVILPAYRPPEEMTEFIRALVGAGFSDILLVDDGSGPAYAALFDRAEKDGAALLRHEKKQRQGRSAENGLPRLHGAGTATQSGDHRRLRRSASN